MHTEPGMELEKISVVIPTHNRPELLREALASVAAQSYPDWEVVVVDDGSSNPVAIRDMSKKWRSRVQIIRNEHPKKTPCAREQGARLANGSLILHLDDDDLLAPDAMERGHDIFRRDPSIEVLFLGVKGFGSRGEHFDSAQSRALSHVLVRAAGKSVSSDLVSFGPELIVALLQSVPMAFQRSLSRVDAWETVSACRRATYRAAKAEASDSAVPCKLDPMLRESEWAMYAALMCRTALLNANVYLQRCEGQGGFSRSDQSVHAMSAKIEIIEHLLAVSKSTDIVAPWRGNIRRELAASIFDLSYHLFHSGKRIAAYRALRRALTVVPRPAYFRFGLRMLLPRLGGGDIP